MQTVTRFRRRTPIAAIALAALACGFVSGAVTGATALRAQAARQVERCNAAADPIACLVANASQQELEPQQ